MSHTNAKHVSEKPIKTIVISHNTILLKENHISFDKTTYLYTKENISQKNKSCLTEKQIMSHKNSNHVSQKLKSCLTET